ncbi:MAG: xanthine dehydrogenase family protein subunit M [Acidobacteriota bacterium]|nr:xanthine dehydrogenase family protein subunit M [Acidobacteriota bacterium]
MISRNFEYEAPSTLHEAMALIETGGKPLAGGMSLVPMMKLRLAAPERIVDLGRIPGLNFIREEAGGIHIGIHIGAMTTYYEIESSPLLRAKCPLMTETVKHVGDVQVRNTGTLGGSTAHADPAADFPAALIALEAKVKLASSKGERTIPIGDFFLDTFTTAIEPGELLIEIVVPIDASGTEVSYQKFKQPASGYAIVGVAARVRKTAGKVDFVRVGITGLGGIAFRATNVEKLLEGSDGSAQAVQNAAAVAGEGVDANGDLFASADFRRHLTRVYTARALTEALSRAA